MQEMLSKCERETRATTTTVQPVTLIIDDKYTQKAIEFIKDAKREIRICAYAWRWYALEPEIGIQKLNVELIRAKERGVKLYCLVDTIAICSHISSLGLHCRCVATNKMLHTKAICVDDKTLVIGSHNLTKRANTDNYEISVAIQQYEPIAQFIDYFDRMWASRA